MTGTSVRPSSKRWLTIAGLVFGILVALAAAWKVGPRVYNAQRQKQFEGRHVYDEQANVAAEFQSGLERAAREHKRILVVFGGNWCKWCLALDDLFKSDAEIKSYLDGRYVLLKFDSDAASDLNESWGKPTRLGVPVLVFVNADGKVLHVQNSGELEKWGGRILGHDRTRVLTLLQQWAA